MEPYKVPVSRGVRGRGRFSQSADWGRVSSNSFLGQGQGHARFQQNPRPRQPRTRVGLPGEVSHTTLAFIIANQIPIKAGLLRDCLHVWKTITSDLFIWVQLLTVILNLIGYPDHVLVLLGLFVPLLK